MIGQLCLFRNRPFLVSVFEYLIKRTVQHFFHGDALHDLHMLIAVAEDKINAVSVFIKNKLNHAVCIGHIVQNTAFLKKSQGRSHSTFGFMYWYREENELRFAVFYCARMLSAQLDTITEYGIETTISTYEKQAEGRSFCLLLVVCTKKIMQFL